MALQNNQSLATVFHPGSIRLFSGKARTYLSKSVDGNEMKYN